MRDNSARILLTFLIFAGICSEYQSLFFTPVQTRNKRNQDQEKNSEFGSCSAPTFENGHVIILGHSPHNYKPSPGESVPNYMSIKFKCNQNYALFPNQKVVTCDNGEWTNSIPTCKMSCPPLTSTTLDITCTFNNKTTDCSKPVLEGTVAKTKCKDFYVSVHTYAVPIIKCKGGSWDNSLIQCIPDCGEGIAKGSTNVVNGTKAKLGEFPWHVAIYHRIYDQYEYKCGGSIIHPLVVLSAAHCFQDKNGVNIPADEFYVAAGKYHSAYNSEEDKLAQIHQVHEYHIPPYYSGIISNYQADLVVIVLKTKFGLSNLVRPVCVDWNREFEREQLLAGTNGSVVGWGYEVPDMLKVSKSLKKLTAPFIEISKCLTVVPEEFKRWVTPDKFCAGFTTGLSVCHGDSGGGMVFPWHINNKLKYYLRGIVSVGPSDDNGFCDSYQYGVYTQISHYSDFIQEVVANNAEVAEAKSCFSSSIGSCQIPVIENGKSIYLDKNFLAGYSVPSYSYIQIYCNKGYALYPKKRYVHCVNSTWLIPIPECKQTCPPLTSSLARNITCTVDDKTVKCSRPAIDGAIAQITCKDGSELFTKCTKGSWDKRDPFSRCEESDIIEDYRPPQQLPKNGCPVQTIEYGKLITFGFELDYKEGVYVPNNVAASISCNSGYAVYPKRSEIITCENGTWIPKIPECKRKCSPIISTSVEVICSVDDETVDCTKPMGEGTVVKSSCKEFYTAVDPRSFSTIRCIDGAWSNPLMSCVPECGNSDGQELKRFPWHVGIYKLRQFKYEYICGGSIITPSIVLSAAHCVLHTIKPIFEFYIAAGKYYREFSTFQDGLAQARKVEKIVTPPLYKGAETNYVADMAIIFVHKPFELTTAVLPVCVDWTRQFERQLRPNSVGITVGWKNDPDDMEGSEVLEENKFPFIAPETCLNSVPPSAVPFITTDKFCSGYINGTGPCHNSGNGLVFPWTVNNKVKYFLRGIASVGLSRDCGKNYALFTQVSYYSDFFEFITHSEGVNTANR